MNAPPPLSTSVHEVNRSPTPRSKELLRALVPSGARGPRPDAFEPQPPRLSAAALEHLGQGAPRADPLAHFTAHPEEHSAHLAAVEFLDLHTEQNARGRATVDVRAVVELLARFLAEPAHLLQRSQLLGAVLYQLSRRDEAAHEATVRGLQALREQHLPLVLPAAAADPDHFQGALDDPEAEADLAEEVRHHRR